MTNKTSREIPDGPKTNKKAYPYEYAFCSFV